MAKKTYFILMADIIRSRRSDQRELMKDFKEITAIIKRKHGKKFLSPITITLGDEFQSVLPGLGAAIDVIIEMEEAIIRKGKNFKLRYTITEGSIDTPINHKIGYGMMGDGLSQARENIGRLKRTKQRFDVSINNEDLALALGNCFSIYQDFVDDWKLEKDSALISAFIDQKDYKEVAELFGKDRSQIWKRRKNLKIDLYFGLKQIIKYSVAK